MKIKDINDYIKNVNCLKLAGINRFIIIDVFKSRIDIMLIQNKEPVYKLTCSWDFSNYEILSYSTIQYSGSIEEISSILKEFIKKNRAEDAYLIIGINEYRTKTLTIEKEVEDVNLWFLENTEKFIPQGRPSKEFSFSYEKYKEDDEKRYYLIAITREEYISSLTAACENCGVKILSVTAFPLSLHSLGFTRDIRVVYIKISDSVITYLHKDVNGSLFVNELYHRIYIPAEEGGINKMEAESSLNQIAEAIKITSTGNIQGELHLYLSMDKDYFEEICESAKRVLNPVSINKDYEKIAPEQLSTFFGLLKELTQTGDKINFLSGEIISKEREEIEKQITLRVTFACGGVLISLLLVLFMLETFVAGKIKAGQEDLLEVNAKNSLITQFEEENSKINLNLTSLKTLKEKRSAYSPLFKNLSEVVTAQSCFTSLKLDEGENDKNSISITGIALNRKEVALLMKNMEDNNVFSNILLSYSNSISAEEVETNIHVNQKEVIEYKIICEYNNAN